MTNNIIEGNGNKDFDSTVNNSEWTTKPQRLELPCEKQPHASEKARVDEC